MDYPLDEIQARANAAMENFPNADVYFKFTCAACGSRQTFDVPNTLYTTGTCEECGYVTTLVSAGFDMIIHARARPEAVAVPESER